MLLENVTSGASYSTVQSGTGTGMTAEWVAEDTQINGTEPPLANFGTVQFSGAGLGAANSAGSIFNGPVDSISGIGGTTFAEVMMQNNNVMALPGPLSDSGTGSSETSSFNVAYQPVAEPPALALLALGAMAIPLIRRHRAMRR
jgi:hypothetical protein